MNSLGELIDKLTVANLKIWHLEDIKRKKDASDKDVADATRSTNTLNTQRNLLIEEIDTLIVGCFEHRMSCDISHVGTTKVYSE